MLIFLCNGERNIQVSNIRNATLPRVLSNEKILRGDPLIELGAYCLLPNHIHFVIKETQQGGIAAFMRKLFTGYTMYFNRQYKRTGPLFNGSYKSKHLSTDRYFKNAINYVHLNPIGLYEPNWKSSSGSLGIIEEKIRSYRYSSLAEHTGIERAERKILGDEVFTLFDAPSSLSTMLFDAQAFQRDGVDL